jgi:Fe-S-cluster containining protein
MAKKDKKKGAKKDKKRKKVDRSNDLCADCPGKCCHKLLIPFKKPKDESEMAYYRWHLQYDTLNVAIRSNRWYLVIDGRCMYLNKKDMCTIYDDRPDTCRDHNPPNCEHYGEWCDILLESPDELDAWFELEAEKRAKKRKKARKEKEKAGAK